MIRLLTGIIKHILRLVLVLLILVGAALGYANYQVIEATKASIVSESEAQVAGADAVLVLGASVYADGTPSGILQDRLDAAAALYFSGAAPYIIVSGDDSLACYHEAQAMAAYLQNEGVPSDVILQDAAGLSTFESVYHARRVYGCERLIIATQTYHQYRALFDAQSLGMDAIGVAAEQGTYDNQVLFSLREIPARAKDYVLGLAVQRGLAGLAEFAGLTGIDQIAQTISEIA